MTVDTFIELAEAYSDLGSAVQEQLKDVVYETEAYRDGELNRSAVTMIQDFAEKAEREVGSGWDLVVTGAEAYLEQWEV